MRFSGNRISDFADVLRGALRTLHDFVTRGLVCPLAALGPLPDGALRAPIAAVDAFSHAFPRFAAAAWREEYPHTRAHRCSSQDARREGVFATHVCDSAHVCLLVALARAKSASVSGPCNLCASMTGISSDRDRLPHVDSMRHEMPWPVLSAREVPMRRGSR